MPIDSASFLSNRTCNVKNIVTKRPSWQVSTTFAATNPDVSEATPMGGATVVISGGSQGVGRATALKFAQAGRVIVEK